MDNKRNIEVTDEELLEVEAELSAMLATDERHYEIDENRFLSAKKVKGVYEIKIREGDGTKCAEFTLGRWAVFVSILDDIEMNISNIKRQIDTPYREHIGGGWFVSVMIDLYCVDIRKFYQPWGETYQIPTEAGVSIRLEEWPKVREDVILLHAAAPEIANAVPCVFNNDHLNKLNYANCKECFPFEMWSKRRLRQGYPFAWKNDRRCEKS